MVWETAKDICDKPKFATHFWNILLMKKLLKYIQEFERSNQGTAVH